MHRATLVAHRELLAGAGMRMRFLRMRPLIIDPKPESAPSKPTEVARER